MVPKVFLCQRNISSKVANHFTYAMIWHPQWLFWDSWHSETVQVQYTYQHRPCPLTEASATSDRAAGESGPTRQDTVHRWSSDRYGRNCSVTLLVTREQSIWEQQLTNVYYIQGSNSSGTTDKLSFLSTSP